MDNKGKSLFAAMRLEPVKPVAELPVSEEDKRLKKLEADRAALQRQYNDASKIPTAGEIAQVAAILAQREPPQKDEIAAVLRGTPSSLERLARPHVAMAFALWVASRNEVQEYIESQIHDVEMAIELHPHDLHPDGETDEQTTFFRVTPPVKFEEALRMVIGKKVRLEDRHKRFKDWLRMMVRDRVEGEYKPGQLSKEVFEQTVDVEFAQRLDALKKDGFDKGQWNSFRVNYGRWWPFHLRDKLKQRGKKAANKRWRKGMS